MFDALVVLKLGIVILVATRSADRDSVSKWVGAEVIMAEVVGKARILVL